MSLEEMFASLTVLLSIAEGALSGGPREDG